MNKRKFFGTILGIIFWSCCIVFFTFAYYEWKSENTNVALGIQDLTTKCIPGTEVIATNIGPVLDYKDGVKAEFSIENQTSKVMAIDLRLDITSISDNLKTEPLKYAVVTDVTGGINYDYVNPVITGSFTNFEVGSNVIMTDLAVSSSITQKFLFIVYIDGNMYNSPNMQENSLIANLLIGNCEENSLSMDTFVYQAIYSEDDQSLTFVHTTPLTVGSTYNNKTVTSVYTGFETTTYSSIAAVPWSNDDSITNITFEAMISPVSTAYWFASLPNLTTVDLARLDTSNVKRMDYMFYNCTNLISLDLSNFDTSKVTNMKAMFHSCQKLTSLDLSSFNTSNVLIIDAMFTGCQKLTSLDLSNFDTSKVINMSDMFSNCLNLTSLNISGFDTSEVTAMSNMFNNCQNLTSLNVSNFNTSNVENMMSMFNGCQKLASLDLSNFDTSEVTDMSNMFKYCDNLTSLNVSKFDTSKVTNMRAMFNGCRSLTSLNVSNFNTSNVENMRAMFYECNVLTSLDLSNFNTSKVTDMTNMFAYSSLLKNLNLGTFDTSNVLEMVGIFNDCYNLITSITIRNSSTTYTDMFENTSVETGAQTIVNYTSNTSNLVDSMIATKSSRSNVSKGSLVL